MNGLLTAQEAAKRLRLHINTLYILIAKGKLIATKVCGRWRIKEQHLEEFVNGRH